MPNKKPRKKDEGGAFGPSAKETKQSRGNVPLGKGKAAQRLEWWRQQKATRKKDKPKTWTNRGVNDPWWPRSRV